MDKCPIKLVTMKEWVAGKGETGCRPCILPVAMSWYHQELTERGHQDQAKKLDEARRTERPDSVCAAMDEIKAQVSQETRERLLEFDCATQSFKEEAEETS